MADSYNFAQGLSGETGPENTVENQGRMLNQQLQEQAAAENAAATATPQGQQEAQQMADYATNAALAGTPVTANFPPVNQRQPVGPVPYPEAQTLPSTLQAPVTPEEQAAMIQQDADIGQMAAATVQQAKTNAAQAVQINEDELNQRAIAAAQAADQKVEAKVAKDMGEGTNWGQMIGQAIAIMMGARAQGLANLKENPAVQAIDKAIERQAAARKYSQEERDKAFEIALKMANLEIEKKKAATDSFYKQQQYGKTQLEIQKLQQDINQNGQMTQFAKSKGLKQEDVDAIPLNPEGDKLRQRLVRLPDGSYTPVNDSEVAKKLNQEYIPNAANAQAAIGKLNELADYFGDNPIKKFASREEIAVANQSIQELVGQIRPEYFGPGAFTDTEQKIARSLIGDPSKFLSMSSATKASLRNMQQKMQSAVRRRITQAGGNLAPSVNDANVQIMKQHNPKLSETQIMDALQRAGKWKAE